MKSLSFFRLLAITAFSFALTLVSNTLEPAVLGHKVLELVPDRRNTALGFATFAGLIVAILAQPIVGVFSDRTRSRLGRRLPYLIAGTLMVIACLYLIALAPAFGLVVLGIMLIQVASNTVQGPWQALIPDLVPEAQRGRASGLKAMLDILAFVVGRQVAGQLVGRYPQWGETAILIAVTVPVVVYLFALAVTAWWAREPPEAAAQAPQRSMREAIASTFSVDFRAHPAFGWWFANRMLFWAAFIALSTFLLFFMIDVVGMGEADAQKYVGTLSTLLGAALVVVTLPSGWVADRVGRKPVVIASGVVAALGAGIILLSRDINLITAGGVVVGLGVGVFMSANWALITDIVPRAEAARYLGIANIATAGGSAVARFLGGALIDPLNKMLDSTSAGYFTVYAIAAGFFLLSALVIIPLPSSQIRK